MKLKIMAVLTALMTLVGTSAYAAATAEECQATFAKFKDLGKHQAKGFDEEHNLYALVKEKR